MRPVIRSPTVALIAVAGAACSSLPHGQASSCLGEDPYIANQRSEWTRIVAGEDTASTRLRAAFKLLPATSREVVLVTDEKLCSRAAAAFGHAIGTAADPKRPVWVLELGPHRYFVADGWRKSSDRYVAVIFDESFQHLSTMLTS